MTEKKKKILILSSCALILVVVAFYAGRISVTAVSGDFNKNAQFAGRMQQGRKGNIGSQQKGLDNGMTGGEIKTIGPDSLTLSLDNGGSKIIYFSASTTVWNMATSELSTLSVGQQVMVSGTASSDGSIQAKSLQIRPIELDERPSFNSSDQNDIRDDQGLKDGQGR